MGDQPARAGEDRNGADQRGRNADIDQGRRDGHRDVHRQRLAPGLGDRLGQRRRRLDGAAGDSPLAGKRDHSLGARIDRLVQRMAVTGDRPARRAIIARDLERRRFNRTGGARAREHLVDQRAAEVGRAEDDRAAAEYAGRNRALEGGRVGRKRHPGGLNGRREPVFGERHEAEVEEEALGVGRRTAGREQVDEVGEGRAPHQVGGQVAPAYPNPVGRRDGDLRLSRAGLADQHDVSSHGPAASRWRELISRQCDVCQTKSKRRRQRFRDRSCPRAMSARRIGCG